MKHIFISASSRDRNLLSTLRDNLVRIGYRPWVDPKPRPGQDWRFDLDDAIRASDAVIVIVTPAAADSVYVTYEWSLALGLGIPVIPIIFKSAKTHPRLRALEHFDYTGASEPRSFWAYFTQEIQRMIPNTPQEAQPQLQNQPPIPMPKANYPQQAQPVPTYTRNVMPTQPGYWLVMRRGPDLNAMHLLQGEIITLGRDDANNIPIADPEVSRYHLRFVWQGQGYAVEDLGSTNGTRINGGPKVTTLTPLQPGQALMLGDAIILSYEAVSP